MIKHIKGSFTTSPSIAHKTASWLPSQQFRLHPFAYGSYQTSLTGLNAPRHVTHKPRLVSQAPGPIPSAHRPIAIIDQPTGPVTAQN
ncbi:hypothetical protein F2Q69_00005809 [Brassica cretica]|uniref:Uncharacterized protein n=1 Tax=Brassica cretica TaxID=69181 RepID=A0A8S9P705_BRACR|nr:hypothetical protein F2Q69_00005809 [Brassica cretica]